MEPNVSLPRYQHMEVLIHDLDEAILHNPHMPMTAVVLAGNSLAGRYQGHRCRSISFVRIGIVTEVYFTT